MEDLEIERKFLVSDLSVIERMYDDESGPAGTSIVQGYLAVEGERSARVRVTPEQATLAVKGPRSGSVRVELETGIPLELGEQLLILCGQRLVSKMRYPVVEAGHIWVIDVFQDENEGLALAEVELGSPDEEVEAPAWCGAEVTDDERYYNVYLAQFPFRAWPR